MHYEALMLLMLTLVAENVICCSRTLHEAVKLPNWYFLMASTHHVSELL